jgi:UDP-2,3-diacylglucosamine hydrolase
MPWTGCFLYPRSLKLIQGTGEDNPQGMALEHIRLVTQAFASLPSIPMSELPIYLASDVHLGSAPEGTEGAFLSWLDHCGTEASRVIINGDLFDFWFEYRNAIPRGHTRILGALASLVDAGVPILFLGGNHDWWGGSYLRNEIGVDFRQEPLTLDLQGRNSYLAHGDGVGRGDLGYRMLRVLIRSTLTQHAFRFIHPDLGAWIARRVSKTGNRTGEALAKQLPRSKFLEEWGVALLEADPSLHLVALGHTHIPVLREVAPGRHYLNSGDWLVNRSFAVLREGEVPALFSWGDRGPGEPIEESS